jgi:hypothetical protein
MSRAMNLALPEEDVVAACAKNAVSVSCTEPLLSGGTHLVCTTGEGAEEMRIQLKKHIIKGAVQRLAFYRPKNSW